MRPTTLATACVLLACGLCLPSAQAQYVGSPGGGSSTGPTSGTSGTTRSTGTTPDALARPGQSGLPANLGRAGEAGGRPMMDRLDTPRGFRDQRLDSRDRSLGRTIPRRDTRSVERYPASRLFPTRPSSPEDTEKNRYRQPMPPEEGSISAAQRRALGRRTGADFTLQECIQIYDSGTRMTRQAWNDSCRRTTTSAPR
jgi:hypothetical protein